MSDTQTQSLSVPARDAGDGDLAADESALLKDEVTDADSAEELGALNSLEALADSLDTSTAEESNVLIESGTDEDLEDEADADDEAEDDAEAEDEAETDDDAEDDADADDDAEDDADADEPVAMRDIPKAVRPQVRKLLSQEISKRVSTEIEKTRAAREEAERLRSAEATAAAELAEVKAARAVPVATAADPLADVMDLGQLAQIRQAAETLDDWMDVHEDALNDGEELAHPFDAKRTLDLQQARELKLLVKRELRAVPQRQEYLRQYTQSEQLLVEKEPALADPKSPWSVEVNQVISQLPELKRGPAYRANALCYVAGRKLAAWAYERGQTLEQALAGLPGPEKAAAKAAEPKVQEQADVRKQPRKPVARPVPAVRQSGVKTTRPMVSGAINTLDELAVSLGG